MELYIYVNKDDFLKKGFYKTEIPLDALPEQAPINSNIKKLLAIVYGDTANDTFLVNGIPTPKRNVLTQIIQKTLKSVTNHSPELFGNKPSILRTAKVYNGMLGNDENYVNFFAVGLSKQTRLDILGVRGEANERLMLQLASVVIPNISKKYTVKKLKKVNLGLLKLLSTDAPPQTVDKIPEFKPVPSREVAEMINKEYVKATGRRSLVPDCLKELFRLFRTGGDALDIFFWSTRLQFWSHSDACVSSRIIPARVILQITNTSRFNDTIPLTAGYLVNQKFEPYPIDEIQLVFTGEKYEAVTKKNALIPYAFLVWLINAYVSFVTKGNIYIPPVTNYKKFLKSALSHPLWAKTRITLNGNRELYRKVSERLPSGWAVVSYPVTSDPAPIDLVTIYDYINNKLMIFTYEKYLKLLRKVMNGVEVPNKWITEAVKRARVFSADKKTILYTFIDYERFSSPVTLKVKNVKKYLGSHRIDPPSLLGASFRGINDNYGTRRKNHTFYANVTKEGEVELGSGYLYDVGYMFGAINRNALSARGYTTNVSDEAELFEAPITYKEIFDDILLTGYGDARRPNTRPNLLINIGNFVSLVNEDYMPFYPQIVRTMGDKYVY